MQMSLGRLMAAILMAFAVVIILTLPLYAEIYRWVDENGVTHFSDQKPVGTDAGKEETVDPTTLGSLSVLEGGEHKPSAAQYIKELLNFGSEKEINRTSSVEIYTTPT